jgi:uncharacterized protein (TIGR03435 family)
MKSFFSSVCIGLFVTATAVPIARSQVSLQGTWQGVLHSKSDQRLVVKIAKASGTSYTATLYSVDRSPQAFPSSPFEASGSDVQFTLPGLGARYAGKLSNDKQSLEGSLIQQSGSSLPLKLAHVTEDAAWPIPKAADALKPMPADADPSFAVSTIKPSNPDEPSKNYRLRGRTFSLTGFTVADLMVFAYDIHSTQIIGAPKWVTSTTYDIVGQPDIEGVPSIPQIKTMVQKLLAQRFHLVLHNDHKTLPVFILSRGTGAPKLTVEPSWPNNLPEFGARGPGILNVRNATMPEFTKMVLQGIVLDRPVLDQTSLSARYDFTLNWTPEPSEYGGKAAQLPPPSDAADAPPNLFTAVQEQLGLKLIAAKAPADVLVVDQISPPDAN